MQLQITQPVASKHKSQVKDLNERNVDSEDDLQHSRSPSMTDGSSRTSSVSSMSDHRSVALNMGSFAQQQFYMSACGRHVTWLPPGDEHKNLPHRTESPSPLRQSTVPRRLRDSTPLSTGLDDLQNVHNSYEETLGTPLGVSREDSHPTKALGSEPVSPQSLPVAMGNSDVADSKALSGKGVIESQSAKSSSESEDDSDDEDCGEDDNWSGANDHLERDIYKAVFPDVALAANLISKMYSMLFLSSSKRVSKKVSSWQERITSCAGTTVSGATSTEKATSTSGSSSGLRRENSKRNRLGGSTNSNLGEEDEDADDDEDSDGSRRKRFKENSFVIPTQRLACPFNKMDSSKYGIQHNQDGKNKYRTCSGPGFLSISLLKEHLKRKHYPVQCERCYTIFKFKGTNRSPAVAELEKHRQLDDVCPRGSPSMKEGISEAQWTNLSEEKHSRKGKASMTDVPKSDVDKWKDIWRILFPDLPVPLYPWYDTPSIDVTGSTPSQGLHPYLKVYEEILAYELPTIEKARSDSELISLLLEIARKSFEVWSTTCRWNERLTSSLSSTSWENIPKPTSSPQKASPKASAFSVFPNLNPSGEDSHPGANFSTDQAGSLANLRELPEDIPYSIGTVTPSLQATMPVSSSFEFGATLGAEYPAFPQNGYNGYSANTTGIGSHEWMTHEMSQMEQMEARANTFDMGLIPHQDTHIAPPPHWQSGYHPHHFGRFGDGP